MKKYTKNTSALFAVLCSVSLLFTSACGKAQVPSLESAAPSENISEEVTSEDSIENTSDNVSSDNIKSDETVMDSDNINDTEETEEKPLTNVNIIPAGDFSEDNSHWGLYKESGGSASLSRSAGQLKLKITNPGYKLHSVQIYCDGFELLEGGEYEFSFDIYSTVDRTFEWRIQLNGGDYHPYVLNDKEAITTSPQTIVCNFTMEDSSDPAPRLCFNFGDLSHEQNLEAHEIYLDNVSLVLKDSENAATVDTDTGEVNVNLNQLGYHPEDTKRAIVRSSSLDETFEVIDTSSGSVAFEGQLVTGKNRGNSGEKTSFGDFTALTTPGTYKVHTENNGDSFEFVISDSPYKEAMNAALKMFYLQRCGMDLTSEYAGDFAHTACHKDLATIYGSSQKIDVSGGWHDAGDYGRYTSAAAKAVADLLLAYETNPSVFTDDCGIPESGNGIPDILDEARYELDWLMKMQASDGGVYHKVTGLNFDGIAMPEDCNDELYVLPQSKTSTADFAAVMYIASRVYENIDSSFSSDCIKAAQKAIPYYEAHISERNFTNPTDVLTGEYADGNSMDEYLWALCEGYKTSSDNYFADKIKSFNFDQLPEDEGLGWANMKGYAYYAYLTAKNPVKTNYTFKTNLLTNAEELKDIAFTESYCSTIKDDYTWGSNMTICNNGLILLMANEISSNSDYVEASRMQLDYICGANTTSYCFLTGYGSLCPKYPHHRPSQALDKCMPGMLVGGPDSNLEDPFAKKVLANYPKAHRYFDSAQSYSCNEITIYWNSAFVYLLSYYL